MDVKSRGDYVSLRDENLYEVTRKFCSSLDARRGGKNKEMDDFNYLRPDIPYRHDIPYKIIRSKRRTLAFEVTRDARLIVRAPERTPLDFIEKVVLKKHLWIDNKQKLAKETYHQVQPKEFVNGEGFLYLGNTYRLCIVDESNPPVLLEQEFRLSREYLPKARELFINWYKKQAEQKIKERVDWYSNLFGFKYNRFSITNAQKRWGSCSANDNLHFSWRLIMAPLSVIDYVVVHELVHVERKNHSQEFWNRIKIITPNYQESRIWLKENEHRLVC